MITLEDPSLVEAGLFLVIYQLLVDLKNHKALNAISLEANLNNDLGIGSLERIELLTRLEQHFSVTLPADYIFSAIFVKDLLPPLNKAEPTLTDSHFPNPYILVPQFPKIVSLFENPITKEDSDSQENNKIKEDSCFWISLKNIFLFLPRLLYVLYFYAIAIITVFFLWLAAWIVPGNSKIFPYLAPYWAKIFLFLVGCPLNVTGKEHIIHNQGVIYVANHASYLDTIILCASIPRDLIFVAKDDLLKLWVMKPFFKKQEHITVDRGDFAAAAGIIAPIKNALHRQRAVVIYPEATFVDTPGLRLFKLGAFKVAAETSAPLCPIAIKGARKIMNPLYWGQPSKITVSILPPIYPQANDLAEIVRLRDLSREMIAQESGESLLDLAAGGFLGNDDKRENFNTGPARF